LHIPGMHRCNANYGHPQEEHVPYQLPSFVCMSNNLIHSAPISPSVQPFFE
jgi:hypothetical protein